MTPRYVLDTDILSEYQRGNSRVTERVTGTDPRLVATTIVSAYEQLRGRFGPVVKAESRRIPAEIIATYRRLRETIEFFRDVQVIDYSLGAEQCFAVHRREITVQKVKTPDLRIACIALSIGATLVTRNRSHYQEIPNLPVEDWSA